jgi:hypothetical protein
MSCGVPCDSLWSLVQNFHFDGIMVGCINLATPDHEEFAEVVQMILFRGEALIWPICSQRLLKFA